MLTAVERQILAPPVRIAAEGDGTTGINLGHRIGARAHRRDQGRFAELAPLPRGLAQNRAQTQNQWKFAVLRVEGEAHAAWPGDLGPGNLFPGARIARLSFRRERLERPDHIFGGDRGAVGKARLFTQGKLDVAARLVGLDGFGKQAIQTEGFIQRSSHQRLNRELGDLIWRISLYDERVEAIETALLTQCDAPPFGGVRVHIGKVREARCQCRFAMHGDGAHGGFGKGRLGRQHGARQPEDSRQMAEMDWSHSGNAFVLPCFSWARD